MEDFDTAGHLTLAETSRRLGEAIWIEERLFERLGEWSASDLPARTRVVLSEVSRRHAWRAEQLRARVPEVPGFAADDVIGPPAGEVDDLLGTVSTAEVVDALVAPLDAAYEAHIARCSPVADAAVDRTLRVVLADLRCDAELLRAVL